MTLLKETLQNWISTLPSELLQTLEISPDELLQAFPKTYMLYKPMLLLPTHTFLSKPWTKLVKTLEPPSRLNELYEQIARIMDVTHIAINAAIPLLNNNKGIRNSEITTSSMEEENILRSPSNLQPLYGDFGHLVTSTTPTIQDLKDAFWVSAKQNGIYQTWAPVYTMFSRGNISEKARILQLPTLRPPVLDPAESTAVDLYAGIGYFAFSYAAAGVAKVLCWELNPWSVEGLRRGAEGNKWAVEVVEDDEVFVIDSEDVDALETKRIVVFRETNSEALRRIEALREVLPPVRHVNCGLLPSSRGSWRIAVEVLDPEYGGWVHVHQNVAVKDIDQVKSEILAEICDLVKVVESRRWRDGPGQHGQSEMQVECEHVEQVKSYAPGVMHCVLDIKIAPRPAIDRISS